MKTDLSFFSTIRFWVMLWIASMIWSDVFIVDQLTKNGSSMAHTVLGLLGAWGVACTVGTTLTITALGLFVLAKRLLRARQ